MGKQTKKPESTQRQSNSETELPPSLKCLEGDYRLGEFLCNKAAVDAKWLASQAWKHLPAILLLLYLALRVSGFTLW